MSNQHLCTFGFYKSNPNKDEDECKNLSIVITKDGVPFCWITYKNYRYRRDNLGVTQVQLLENEKAAYAEETRALNVAAMLAKSFDDCSIDASKYKNKQLPINKALL